MSNKRGMAADDLKGIILVLLSLGLLYFVITGGYIPFLSGSGSKQACKNWVDLQSLSLFKEFRNLKSPCLTYEDTIKNVKDEKEIYKKLADNMYECWDTYGRGEADFYKYIDWSGTKFCRVCSEVKISSDLTQDKRNIDIDKFEQYLTNEHPPNNRDSYAEFLTKVDNAKINFGSGTLSLDPDKRIYTIFMVYKKAQAPNFVHEDLAKPSFIQFGVDMAGCAVAGEVGFLAGSIVPGAGNVIGGIAGSAGCLLGVVGGEIINNVIAGEYFYPSVILLNQDSNQIKNSCNYIYYKPENFEGKE